MIYHLAAKVRADGNVSALCYETPRPIPLTRGHSWVLETDRVTCPKCRKIAKAQGRTSALVKPDASGDAHTATGRVDA